MGMTEPSSRLWTKPKRPRLLTEVRRKVFELGIIGADVTVVALGEDAGLDQRFGGVRDDLSVLGEYGCCHGRISFNRSAAGFGTRRQGRRVGASTGSYGFRRLKVYGAHKQEYRLDPN